MVFTEIWRFTTALGKRLPYSLRDGLAVDRLLDHIRRTVFHQLECLVAFAGESTDHYDRKPKSKAVMLQVHLADLPQERLAVFDVAFDGVRLALDLEIEKNQTEGPGI